MPGETVEADNGYRGIESIMTPGVGKDFADRRKKSQARGRQEAVNAWLKDFNILSDVWRYDLVKHRYVFSAIAVLVQLSFSERPIFDVDCDGVTYK